MPYDHTKPSRFGIDECEDAVGRTALLILSGKIVEAGESWAGAFVKFQVDECWGLGDDFKIVLDLDALYVQSR